MCSRACMEVEKDIDRDDPDQLCPGSETQFLRSRCCMEAEMKLMQMNNDIDVNEI